MNIKNLLQFISLGAIWGASFIFIRVLVPVLGPIVTANMRTLIAGVVLTLYLIFSKIDFDLEKYWKKYIVVGILNTGIPFILFAYASKYLPASYLAILNSTSPLFTAVFSVIWLKEKVGPLKIFGISLGAFGVALVANIGELGMSFNTVLAIFMSLGAAASYALTGVYMQLYLRSANPKSVAGISQLFAGVILLPLVFIFPPIGDITLKIGANMISLALLCSAVAYLMYFDLMKDIGPTKALSVTYLIPLFGMLWGVIFLDEVITFNMILGCVFILLGTCLVLNLIKVRRKKNSEFIA